jgi:hypothetical protein
VGVRRPSAAESLVSSPFLVEDHGIGKGGKLSKENNERLKNININITVRKPFAGFLGMRLHASCYVCLSIGLTPTVKGED